MGGFFGYTVGGGYMMSKNLESPAIFIKQLQLGPMMNFIYIVGCPGTGKAAVIDPGWEVQAILEEARDAGFSISHILLTHGHPDHIGGVEGLLEATGAGVYVHEAEREYMRQAATLFQMRVDYLDRYAEKIRYVSDGQTIPLGGLEIHPIHTPGHSPGSQCFLVGKNLFSGDTLFVGECGRVDFPGGDPKKMWFSLNRTLRALDDDIVLYPGHNYGHSPTSTMGDEKKHNRYMQYHSLGGFLHEMGS
jgi:hydroxyacylglutathione hydrolase